MVVLSGAISRLVALVVRLVALVVASNLISNYAPLRMKTLCNHLKLIEH